MASQKEQKFLNSFIPNNNYKLYESRSCSV